MGAVLLHYAQGLAVKEEFGGSTPPWSFFVFFQLVALALAVPAPHMTTAFTKIVQMSYKRVALVDLDSAVVSGYPKPHPPPQSKWIPSKP